MKSEDKYIEMLKVMVLDHFKDDDIKIFMFGSRASEGNTAQSDVDIGLYSENGIDKAKKSLLIEKIENSNIPYKVDIVDFSEVSEGFRELAMKDAVLWKDSH